jgi:hypothetical protein
MVILLTYQPVYHSEPPPEVARIIERSLAILALWDKVPFMSEPLKRINRFAEEVGWYQARLHRS